MKNNSKLISMMVTITAAIITSVTVTDAKLLCRIINDNTCNPPGYVEYVQDDGNHKIYEHFHGCNGADCWEYYYGTYPCKNVKTVVTTFGGYSSCSMAPNTLTGNGFVDDDLDTFRMRTPVDTTERDEIIAMWIAEFGSVAAPRVPNRIMTDADRAYIRKKEQMIAARAWDAPDIKMVQELLALFIERTNGTRVESKDHHVLEMEPTLRFLNHFEHKGTESNMRITQQPTGANGNIAVVNPVIPIMFGNVRVFNADGQTVWQGFVTGPVAIDLSSSPSGTYFVQGVGRALPINVVR